ncbi:MAG: biopolymer transporter ExbD [Myxococcales bacterium]|nr:biopolymer transporter ExbD [Myxococcales bacterium]
MGGAASGKGGVADASLNVVPFIDLLICLICFLVISAAWTSLSRIDVDQALPKASKTPPKDKPEKKAEINVAITPTGYLVNLFNAENAELGQPKRIPTTGDMKICQGKTGKDGACPGGYQTFKKYDKDKLKETLAGFMKEGKLADKIKVMVAAHDKVQYLHLIGTLDSVLHSCEDEAGKSCLKNPSVGDINLLRAKGFTAFD